MVGGTRGIAGGVPALCYVVQPPKRPALLHALPTASSNNSPGQAHTLAWPAHSATLPLSFAAQLVKRIIKIAFDGL